MHDVAVLGVYASSVDSYALLATGQVWAWGSNAEDQLGDGASGGLSDVPILVRFSDASPVVQVAAGGDAATNGTTLVELADNTYWSWGAGNAYQLGNGISGNQSSPIEFFPPTGVTYSLIASSGATSYGVDTKGDLWSWGQGGRGQIGNGMFRTSRGPTKVITAGVTMISATAQDVEVG
jgi:alpha-tubulin suppressor-like RCC1 family protein